MRLPCTQFKSCQTVIIVESAIRGLSRARGVGRKSNESTADDDMPPCTLVPSLDEGNNGDSVGGGGVRDVGFRAVGRFCLVPCASRGMNAHGDSRRGTGVSRHRPGGAPSGATWAWRRSIWAGDLEAGWGGARWRRWNWDVTVSRLRVPRDAGQRSHVDFGEAGGCFYSWKHGVRLILAMHFLGAGDSNIVRCSTSTVNRRALFGAVV